MLAPYVQTQKKNQEKKSTSEGLIARWSRGSLTRHDLCFVRLSGLARHSQEEAQYAHQWHSVVIAKRDVSLPPFP
jgi:hypothetical protein